MKIRFTVSLSKRIIAALASILSVALPGAAQTTGAAQAKGKALFAPSRLADGKPDLNGIWQAPRGIDANLEAKVNGKNIIVDPSDGRIPYLPDALARKRENARNKAKADPAGKCFLPGVPRIMYSPDPFMIVQDGDQFAVLSQFAHAVRHFYLKRDKHLPDIDFWMGDSLARWDGDVLVVDTADFNDQTWFDAAGDYHSDALHVTERFSRTGPETISYEATLEDPKVFSRPWKIAYALALHTEKNFQIMEHECFLDEEGPTVTAGTRPDPHRESK